MYYARLKIAFDESGFTKKQLAEKSKVSEKTIKRILDNPDYHADMDTMVLIAKALGITMQELFAETDVVLIRKDVLAVLEESKKFADEYRTIAGDKLFPKEQLASFIKTIDVLETEIKHKDEIIRIHESYKNTVDSLARIITCRSTDTQ